MVQEAKKIQRDTCPPAPYFPRLWIRIKIYQAHFMLIIEWKTFG